MCPGEGLLLYVAIAKQSGRVPTVSLALFVVVLGYIITNVESLQVKYLDLLRSSISIQVSPLYSLHVYEVCNAIQIQPSLSTILFGLSPTVVDGLLLVLLYSIQHGIVLSHYCLGKSSNSTPGELSLGLLPILKKDARLLV